MSASCAAAARLAITLPTPQANAAKKKRSAASAKGGNSRKPTLIGTNVKPNSVTTASVNSRSRGASACFMPIGAALRLGETLFASLARCWPASQLDDAAGPQRFAQGEGDPRCLGLASLLQLDRAPLAP